MYLLLIPIAYYSFLLLGKVNKQLGETIGLGLLVGLSYAGGLLMILGGIVFLFYLLSLLLY